MIAEAFQKEMEAMLRDSHWDIGVLKKKNLCFIKWCDWLYVEIYCRATKRGGGSVDLSVTIFVSVSEN